MPRLAIIDIPVGLRRRSESHDRPRSETLQEAML
jgi:hypothetical protein